MSREVKFKALSISHRHWVYGLPYITHGTGEFFISRSAGWTPSYSDPDSGDYTELIPCDMATLCQYTGLNDKDGIEIYEGDVLEFKQHKEVVVFKEYSDSEMHEDDSHLGYKCGDWTLPDVNTIAVIVGNIYFEEEL